MSSGSLLAVPPLVARTPRKDGPALVAYPPGPLLKAQRPGRTVRSADAHENPSMNPPRTYQVPLAPRPHHPPQCPAAPGIHAQATCSPVSAEQLARVLIIQGLGLLVKRVPVCRWYDAGAWSAPARWLTLVCPVGHRTANRGLAGESGSSMWTNPRGGIAVVPSSVHLP